MTEHIEESTKQLNYVVGMAGLGIPDPDTSFVVTDEDNFMFKTLWDHEQYQIGEVGNLYPQNVSLALYDSGSADYPKVMQIRSSPPAITDHSTLYYNSVTDHVEILEPYGFIFWVDDLHFKYYDIDGGETTTPADVRAVELWLTFRRDPPRLGGRDLTNRVQLKCYLMNPYMNE
ncbi:MAG: hypothetical protein ACP5F3_07620, partial [Candidatus Syntrophosphaera sp.]